MYVCTHRNTSCINYITHITIQHELSIDPDLLFPGASSTPEMSRDLWRLTTMTHQWMILELYLTKKTSKWNDKGFVYMELSIQPLVNGIISWFIWIYCLSLP